MAQLSETDLIALFETGQATKVSALTAALVADADRVTLSVLYQSRDRLFTRSIAARSSAGRARY
jgi:hypothetical protein